MKRYDIHSDGHEIYVTEKPCGEWVEWEDVQKLQEELDALKKDARWLCKVHIEMAMSEWCEDLIKSDTESGEVVRRIMEATKNIK